MSPSSPRSEPAALRIAVAVHALDVGGGKERDALAIAGGLAARGHAVTILTRSAEMRGPPGTVTRITGTGGWTNHGRSLRFARDVAAARRTGDFDALLTFEKLADADAYYAADVCFAARARGIQNLLPRYAAYRRLENECLRGDGPDILYLCRKQADEYARHYEVGADRTAILPPMLHDAGPRDFYGARASVRREFGIPEDAALAVSIAVYPRQKGVDRTIAALPHLPGLYLLAVGLKDAESAKADAAKYGVGARTRLTGYRKDVGDILGAADLLLHPARVETAGLVIPESLLAGVPVVASAACGFAEFIERFDAGFVVGEPFDLSVYVAAVRKALEPGTLAGLKERARASAPTLRAEGGLARVVDVVEKVLRRKAASRKAESVAGGRG